MSEYSQIYKRDSSLTEEEKDVYLGIINRFIGYYSRRSLKNSKNRTEQEYPFIAMDTRQAVEEIRIARDYLQTEKKDKNEKMTFFDAGCGIGNILLIAEQYFFEVYGIEKDEYPCLLAQQLFGTERVQQADIWDFQDYGNYDVIYYFRPLPDREPESRLELLIENRLSRGAILIANQKLSNEIEEDKRFRRIDAYYPIWQKIRF
ncbi:MAG: class I SAM-dependent methyltransferase [Thermodesulfobacteriota bacterium]